MTKLIDQFGDTHIINDGKDDEVKGFIKAKGRRGGMYAARYFFMKYSKMIK